MEVGEGARGLGRGVWGMEVFYGMGQGPGWGLGDGGWGWLVEVLYGWDRVCVKYWKVLRLLF